MNSLVFSKHALDVLRERAILEEWVWYTMAEPESVELCPDGNTHYIRPIPENSGRRLRIVVNKRVKPNKIVTLFFDRRLGRKQCD